MKRRGVIAALIGACSGVLRGQQPTGGFGPDQSAQGTPGPQGPSGTAFVIDLPLAPHKDPFLHNCHAVEGHYYVECDHTPNPPPYEYALEVRFDGRVVKLTGKEIMDALEGK